MQGRSESNHELLDAAALCRQLVPEGSVEAFLADHRHDLFPDEMFSDLFPSGRGRPSIPADAVASVIVLQALEGLSDRVLSDRLRELELEGVVQRVVYPQIPVRVEYQLTAKGRALEPVVLAIRQWAQTWIALPESSSLLLAE